jgi:hypothetical protein
MPKFVIAFVAPSKDTILKHKIVEATEKESALKAFFNEEASQFYSNDEQGFHYFREDFFDPQAASGSIIQVASGE